MRSFIFVLIMIPVLHVFSQEKVDTVKVYNVYCTYKTADGFEAWGGNFTDCYETKKCPKKDLKKYIKNWKNLQVYLKKEVVFYMKLYNTKEELIYEGFKYSDCSIGPFKCYYTNGKLMKEGTYSGLKFSEKKGYYKKDCKMKQIGTWKWYDSSGEVEKQEVYTQKK